MLLVGIKRLRINHNTLRPARTTLRQPLLQGLGKMSTSSEPLRNVLAQSKSPYLLQHKDNPVAWQEFTPQTIALAKQLDKPIFLSSGYSACHWCHVLAHESFENDEIAEIMNEHFVNIKVDREERPDVDRMYMTFLQATSGGGGWPMSIFMTPGLEPFFAGTYFPRNRFKSVLSKIADMWEDDREQCESMGKNVIEQLKSMGGSSRVSGSLAQILATKPSQKVSNNLKQTHDPRYGGFSPGGVRSTGPKFPSCSMTLEPLARLAITPTEDDTGEEARKMAMKMIRSIWNGGIRDWIGGGVARYSVDEKWIVPHFEKMLYDQGQLASSALDFGLICDPDQAGENESLRKGLSQDRQVCFDLAANIIEYSLRDLLSPQGGFYSAEDADSARRETEKKSEGAFYIWSKEEFEEVVGEDAAVAGWFFGIKVDGNVEPKHDPHGEMTGMNILSMVRTYESTAQKYKLTPDEVKAKVDGACQKLKERRDINRPRPGLDDKILCGWNGLMVTALARASQVLPSETYPVAARCLEAAEGVIDFIKHNMWEQDTKTLHRSWREGKGPTGQTDDYAFLIRGLLDLFEASGKEEYAMFAMELQDRQDALFWDTEAGGYFASAPDEHVLIRMKDAQDSAEPSATSVSAHNNSRLSLLVSDKFEQYETRAEETYLSIGAELQQIPRAFGYSVCGLMDLERGYKEYIVSGSASDSRTKDLLKLVRNLYIPNKVLIHLDPADLPMKLVKVNSVLGSLVETIKGEEPSLRICEGGACQMPIFNVEQARAAVHA